MRLRVGTQWVEPNQRVRWDWMPNIFPSPYLNSGVYIYIYIYTLTHIFRPLIDSNQSLLTLVGTFISNPIIYWDLSVQNLVNIQGDDVLCNLNLREWIARSKSIGRKWLRWIAHRVGKCKHTNALKVAMN